MAGSHNPQGDMCGGELEGPWSAPTVVVDTVAYPSP